MTVEQLDFAFPFLVFGYGAVMTFVLHHETLMRLAQERLPSNLNQQIHSHRWIGLLSLIVGAVWSLQNMWLG